jgi:hypothetical protein
MNHTLIIGGTGTVGRHVLSKAPSSNGSPITLRNFEERLKARSDATSMATRGPFQGEDAMEDKRLAAIAPNPSGLCMCGCGRKTKIVMKSDRRHGHVMGQPFRFIHGHCRPALKGPNRFKLRCRTAVVFLERRDGTVLECLVSRKDFHRVRRHHWYANKNGKGASYAVAWISRSALHLQSSSANTAASRHRHPSGSFHTSAIPRHIEPRRTLLLFTI